MNIRILHLIEGARQATGLTVVIDVFRAFSVETVLMRNRAGKIIPVADVQTAFDYKAKHPDAILCGERAIRSSVSPRNIPGTMPKNICLTPWCANGSPRNAAVCGPM